MADSEEVLDDEAADGGNMEVRVPEEWQKVMSTRTMLDSEPLAFPEALSTCCESIEA